MTNKSLRKECGKYIAEQGVKNPLLFSLEGDLNESTQSILFKEQVPDRHIEMGIAEQHMVGCAAGLASAGKIPIVLSFACFISMRTCEQIRTSICYPRLNVKFLVTHGGVSAGSAGTTHHAIEDIAIMRAIPNLTVVVPGDVTEMKRVVDAALALDGPVYIRLAKEDVQDVFDDTYSFDFGKASTPVQGDDATIVTTGTMLQCGVSAAKELKETHGISTRVVHCASIKPIDEETIVCAARETSLLVTIEEHSVIGGLGGAVCEIVAGMSDGAPVVRLGINDHFCSVGAAPYLFEQEHLTVKDVVDAVLSKRN